MSQEYQEFTEEKRVSLKRLSNGNRLLEALLLLVTVAALFLMIALLTFDPSDPSWSQTAGPLPIHNWGGRVGAWCADMLFFTFGVVAWGIPLVLIVLFRGILRLISGYYYPDYFSIGLRLTGALALTLASCGLAAFNLNDIWYFVSGGVIGSLLSNALVPLLNVAGATLILLCLWAVGFTLLTGWSWLTLAEKLGNAVMQAILFFLNRARPATLSEERKDAVLDSAPAVAQPAPAPVADSPVHTVVPADAPAAETKNPVSPPPQPISPAPAPTAAAPSQAAEALPAAASSPAGAMPFTPAPAPTAAVPSQAAKAPSVAASSSAGAMPFTPAPEAEAAQSAPRRTAASGWSAVKAAPAGNNKVAPQMPPPNRVRIPTRRELASFGIRLPSQQMLARREQEKRERLERQRQLAAYDPRTAQMAHASAVSDVALASVSDAARAAEPLFTDSAAQSLVNPPQHAASFTETAAETTALSAAAISPVSSSSSASQPWLMSAADSAQSETTSADTPWTVPSAAAPSASADREADAHPDDGPAVSTASWTPAYASTQTVPPEAARDPYSTPADASVPSQPIAAAPANPLTGSANVRAAAETPAVFEPAWRNADVQPAQPDTASVAPVAGTAEPSRDAYNASTTQVSPWHAAAPASPQRVAPSEARVHSQTGVDELTATATSPWSASSTTTPSQPRIPEAVSVAAATPDVNRVAEGNTGWSPVGPADAVAPHATAAATQAASVSTDAITAAEADADDAEQQAFQESLFHPFLVRNQDVSLPKPATPLPVLDLLTAPPASEEPVDMYSLKQTAQLVEDRLADYRIKAQVVEISPGPVITRFELDLAPGVKAARISNLSRDLARSLSAVAVRVVEVIPGKPYVGLELPNEHRQTVYLREVLDCAQFRDSASPLTLVLGKDIAGQPVVADLAKMPHLLVAGTTGSGKSVGVNAMILSMLYKATPDDVRFIMIDPKMLELSVYEGIPHLLTEVVTDMKDAANALRWCVGEMERRYKLMSALGVRNIAGYNERVAQADAMGRPIPDPFWKPGDTMDSAPPMLEKLPYIVVIVDEFADLMMAVGKKVEELIARLAQKARAAGIHLVLATQRPSVDVITGLIKANIPTRIAFTVSSKIDSRTILDQGGAESLLGMGDMLYLPPNSSIPLRVHGAFVRDQEVHAVVQDWKARGRPQYIDNITAGEESAAAGLDHDDELDPLFDRAVQFVVEKRRVSVSGVQRQFRIGYNRAARIVEQMEAQGIVSPQGHNGNREVLAPPPHD